MIRNVLSLSLALCLGFCIANTTQAQIINFTLEGQAGTGLLPGNETGTSNSTGFGDVITGIVFDLGTNELTIDVGWGSGNGFGDLTGNATAMHIHGPADMFSNAGVLYNLGALGGFDPSATSGGLNDSLTIAAGDVQALRDGMFYFNVHTSANGSGELRGNLIESIPEPGSLSVLGISCLLFLRRKRSAK